MEVASLPLCSSFCATKARDNAEVAHDAKKQHISSTTVEVYGVSRNCWAPFGDTLKTSSSWASISRNALSCSVNFQRSLHGGLLSSLPDPYVSTGSLGVLHGRHSAFGHDHNSSAASGHLSSLQTALCQVYARAKS